MEMQEERLIGLHESGGLRMYVARMIYISAHSETGQFLRQHRSEEALDYRTITEIDESEDTEEFERTIRVMNEGLQRETESCNKKNTYPASVKLLEIYADCGSYQEVSDRTKIPYKTVYRHINSLRERIIKGK